MNEHLSNSQLGNYADRTLTDTQRESFSLHLNRCQACRGRLAEEEQLRRRISYSILSQKQRLSPSPQLTFTTIAPALRRTGRMNSFFTQSNRLLVGAATLAMLVLLAISLFSIFGGVNHPAPQPDRENVRPAGAAVEVAATAPAAVPDEPARDEANLEPVTGYFEIDQLKVYYEMVGAGPPLVLIHDSLLHREVWDAQFEALARAGYTVIRYDRRGYGLSESNDLGYVNIEDLRALLQALNIDRATLIGSSYGGQMAVDFALAYPDMVEALVLVDAPLSGSSFSQNSFDDHEWREVVYKRYFFLYRVTGRLHSDEEATEAIRMWLDSPLSDNWILPENSQVRERARGLMLANLQNLTHSLLKREAEQTANGRLGEIHVPALIIAGAGDHPDLHEHAQKLATGIANAEMVEIPAAGHLPHFEQPDAFNQVVFEFLKRTVVK